MDGNEKINLHHFGGRLSRESKTGESISGTAFNYDGRGNIVSVNDMALRGRDSQEYSYTGDILNEEKVSRRGLITHTYTFAHDSLGRMTFDGRSGLRMEYNHMDLPSRISSGISISVNYSYLADGTKTSSLTESGEGLVYRGPFTYRRSADGSLTLESVVCSEGRLTPDKALLYATDHLGSVRTVIDGSTGDLLECSDYSAYGTRSIPAATAASTAGSAITFRDHFTGQEDQMPDFNVPYSDHGARLYNPAIRRWMTPDPLSEKYYGLSVYGYCAGNPVNFVDPDGYKLYYANGVSEQFKKQFAATIKFMNSKGTSGDIAKLHASDRVYYIAEASSIGGNRFVADSKGDKTIYWDPNHIMETGEKMQISPTTILAHEADHAQRYDAAQSDASVKASRDADIKDNSDAEYGTVEERRVIEGTEQDAARKHGEIRPDQVTRRKHKDKEIKWIPTGGADPGKISDAVFEHNNIF